MTDIDKLAEEHWQFISDLLLRFSMYFSANFTLKKGDMKNG